MSPSLPVAKRFLPLSALFAVLLSGPASASPNAVHRVPEDFPNIQAAVDAANAGDEISVRAGSWCGATITKRVKLVGRSAGVTIVGCATPVLFEVLRVGFFLPDGAASGTVVRNFNFNGLGVSNQNFDPLALAVFGPTGRRCRHRPQPRSRHGAGLYEHGRQRLERRSQRRARPHRLHLWRRRSLRRG